MSIKVSLLPTDFFLVHIHNLRYIINSSNRLIFVLLYSSPVNRFAAHSFFYFTSHW